MGQQRIMPPEAPPVFAPGELDNMLLEAHAAPTKGERRKAVAEVVKKIKASGVHPLVEIIKMSKDSQVLDITQYVLMNEAILAMFIRNQNLRGVVITWLVDLFGKGVEVGVRLQAASNAQSLLAEGPIDQDHEDWIRQFLAPNPSDEATPMATMLANVSANMLNAIK